jgi:hypothetical protein
MPWLTCLVFLFSVAARAEVSPYLSSYSGAYENVEKLEALGCAYPTFRALGPQSFYDVRAALDWDAERTACDAPEWLMDERQILIRPALALELRSDGFSALDDSVQLPGISASLWPTFPMRQNRPNANGVNLSNELFLSGRSGGQTMGYAASATPGFYAGYDTGGAVLGRFYLQEAYVKVGFGYSEISFGRYARRFGDARHGSLLFSGASAPLDTFEYALRPYVFGGPLQYLGPFSLRTWLGNQGDSAEVPGTQLWGFELGARPFSWWEFAFAQLFQFGGVGAPYLGLGETLTQLIGGGGSGLSGRRHASLALYSGFWGPKHFVKGYGQVLWNRLGDSVSAPFSFQAGLWFPKLNKWDLRLEYARTGSGAYEHPFWRQGLTYAGSTLGHPLGPDGEGIYLDVGLPPISTWWHSEIGGLVESRRLTPGAGQATEKRWGITAAVQRRFGLSDLSLKLAYHQVTGSQYVNGSNIQVLGVGATFRYTFLY